MTSPASPTASLPVIAPVPDTGVGPAPVPGEPMELAPGLLRLTAPNPGLMTGPGTNTYLLGTSDLVLVDPGPDDEVHRAALEAAIAERGTLRFILVTHTHLDHAPGAAALARDTGAQVVGFGPADDFKPDLSVGDGWKLTVATAHGDMTLEALHTPGHASNHLCWLLQESRTLLTGDHVMHGSTVVIRPPDGDLGAYLASLARVRDHDPPIRTLAPGHGRLMQDVTGVIDALIAHRLGRHARVAESLRQAGEGTVDQLLPLVYADVTEAQLPVARFSLWAHLRYLAEQGKAEPIPETITEESIAPDSITDIPESVTDDDQIRARWRWVAASP
jgi:glyoxylase-like metal-dependent hydrolase (beta-lactamase superfamily II)